jgi:hypothetical protein
LNEPDEDLSQPVDITIADFHSLEYYRTTSDDGLYTLTGVNVDGIRKQLRFAPGKHGRARVRLLHELEVLDVLKEALARKIPQPEDVKTFPDRSVCAVYEYTPVESFQQYLRRVVAMDWRSRLGEILKFGQSLIEKLSEIHDAGIFRLIADSLS